MKTSIFKYAVLSIALLAVVACGKKKSDNSVAVQGRDTRTVVAGPSNLPAGQGQMLRQSVYLSPADANFEANAKALASATIKDPNLIGQIKYIHFGGDVSVNPQNGSVVGGTTSYVQIAIEDSNVGCDGDGNCVDPIRIQVTNATGNASNGNVHLTFSDNYGSITVTGTYNNNQFQGQVRYQNNNPASQGVLGNFVIPTCVFFRCN